MPRCRCMNDSHISVSSHFFTHSRVAARFAPSSPQCSPAFAASGSMGRVSHTVALLMTAADALITAPPRSLIPDARPFVTRISSTLDLSIRRPPFFSNPRTNAPTMASEPPTGNSSVLLGLYQSSNMYPISAASVPVAGAPESRKHRTSIQLRMNGCFISFLSKNFEYGAMISGNTGAALSRPGTNRARVTAANGSVRTAEGGSAADAPARGFMSSFSRLHSSAALIPSTSSTYFSSTSMN
mmetsp:Transcript_9716/g.42369  ORF Transcript_9716/g.42369 Transcript_9716/m.42369 type:complete len:241 (-) Transcript_9716:521-1243(-)